MARTHATMEELISHMFIMGRLMRDKMNKNVGTGQCTMLEFETLKYVKDSGKPHMREVAKNFHVTPPAATLLIDTLVKAKLLARILDPKDRRSVRVVVTAKGKQLLERGMTKKVNELKKTFGILTPAERTHFVAVLKKIIKNNS
ncbi:MAG TPA: MarR family transcriptional regulator [Candidatus Paceibacterota bacterium]|nr:MarR family transcriptional regulator [Candidatus Paceibacterota bacterium]